MKKRYLIILIALVQLGCAFKKLTLPPAPVRSVSSSDMVPVQAPSISEPVPMPPKIKSIDWYASLSPIVQQMRSVDATSDNNALLVNTMKNATNGSIQTDKATIVLTRLIIDIIGKFHIINTHQLNIARQTLRLSTDDSLESRSKAVGLARHLNAQYVLYSVAIGDVKQPMIDLQLMSAQTGEIIWSGSGIAQN